MTLPAWKRLSIYSQQAHAPAATNINNGNAYDLRAEPGETRTGFRASLSNAYERPKPRWGFSA
jgi:hypothetical protein